MPPMPPEISTVLSPSLGLACLLLLFVILFSAVVYFFPLRNRPLQSTATSIHKAPSIRLHTDPTCCRCGRHADAWPSVTHPGALYVETSGWLFTRYVVPPPPAARRVSANQYEYESEMIDRAWCDQCVSKCSHIVGSSAALALTLPFDLIKGEVQE
jgi:hypothetical protein